MLWVSPRGSSPAACPRPAGTRVDPQINFNWSNGNTPGTGGLGAVNYSVRWTGQIQPTYSENYTFYLNSDDGSRLYINGQLIIDDYHPQLLAVGLSRPSP